MPKILFTGGGTAGHVTPNIALIEKFQAQNWEIGYVGSKNSIEKQLIEKINIPFYEIPTGKLRRELTLNNLLTPFKVISGIFSAAKLITKLKPQVVFSKGGFVSFPVVVGAWLNRIPVIMHESDITPGLANRLSFPFVKKICVTFPECAPYFKHDSRVIVTGTPLRSSLLQGKAQKGLALCGFNTEKPVLLVMGGSQGSELINKTIRDALPQLLTQYQIIHICGKGKINPEKNNIASYKQFEYVNEELADLLACTSIVICRAGSNSIYELLALKKRHILVPLAKASRGDQIVNAKHFEELGISLVIDENKLTTETLLTKLATVTDAEQFNQQIAKLQLPDSKEMIFQIIDSTIKD